MATVDTGERLAKLRALMQQRKVDVYVVPSEDAHASEYIAACDARRSFISGFTGSAGIAVITHDKAALATDGRYFNQAAAQLDSNWSLLKTGQKDVPSWQEWAIDEAAGGKVVAVDPTLIAPSTAVKLDEGIKNKGGAGLQAVAENLIDMVWDQARPPRPAAKVVLQAEKYTGKDTRTKMAELRKELDKKKGAGFVVSALDEIAWLLNLRGSDIPYNPVFFSYAVILINSVTLYMDSSKLTPDSEAHVIANDITIKPYHALLTDAEELAAQMRADGEAVKRQPFLISNRASWALKLAFGGDELVKEVRSPIGDAKAVKTDAELDGMKQCHVRDGAALIKFFAWLDEQMRHDQRVNEVEAADKLEAFRSQQQNFVGLSFPTISSTGPNAAVIHYQPERGACSVIHRNAIYLCDSGAQYVDGTTDTTRTLHFGQPTEKERRSYTLVLKGHIALDKAIFPEGVTGYALDCLARQFLWNDGLDYRHGTGHGVGSYLNVHEGPFGIGTRKAYADVPLATGNVTSIEPGFYEDGQYGIRIENVALVREARTPHKFDDKRYLGFEKVTMVPFCRSLIDQTLLTAEEKAWLNDYHADVAKKTQGFFENDMHTLSWLQRETAPY